MEPRLSKTRMRQLSNNKAKVKVQYIANHEAVPSEEDIENVEYLEECQVVDENTTDQSLAFDDTFYPNAIHCLISMYHSKYDKLVEGSNPQQIRLITAQVWQDISKNMRDCYFDFNALQVQQKFTQLRQKYFSISSKNDTKEFEYFQPLHAIYQDKYIAEILNTGSSTVDKVPQLRVYHDDVLFSTTADDHASIYKDQAKFDESTSKPNLKISADITHKENEVLDLVERELQAMEQESDTKVVEDSPPLPNLIKQELSDESTDAPTPKRFKLSISASDEHVEVQNEMPQIRQSSPSLADCTATSGSNMSLAAYNAAQQQRHDEKIAIMRQSLLLQEKAIEIQRQLMEQLIKRF